ncbi:MAG: hypothetical protein M0020_00555 [Actinomycetota bacterium]|nr:hypothetical protein [Actinomycetota bacterium]
MASSKTQAGGSKAARTTQARRRGPGRISAPGSGRSSAPGVSDGGRYTPPIPSSVRRSSNIMAGVILGLLALGFLMIILNYVNVFPGGASNWYLFGGLVLLFAGGVTATRFR